MHRLGVTSILVDRPQNSEEGEDRGEEELGGEN